MLFLQALVDILNKILQALPPSDKTGKKTFGASSTGSRVKPGSALTASEGGITKKGKSDKPFDGMNNVVANLLLNLTRFHIPANSYTIYIFLLDRLRYLGVSAL